MATLTLITPPRGEFRFRYRMSLDGTVYAFQWRWNERDQSWYLDLGDASLVSTVRDIRMVIGTDVLAPFQALTTVPPGVLDIVDTSNSNLEATRDDFGTRVLPRYTEIDGA